MAGMPESLLVIGASGNARAVLEVIRAEGRHRVAGLIDSFQPAGVERFGYRILGGEAEIPHILAEHGIHSVMMAIGDNFQRWAMFDRIRRAMPDVRMASCIHPSTVLAPDVVVGEGTVIMPGAVVVSGCRIGQGCLLNTSSSLDHDGEMADWSSLAPGAVTGGRVRIGARSSIGLGAHVIHGVKIGSDTVIGAGALVLHDVPDRVVAYGVPAQPVRDRKPEEPYL